MIIEPISALKDFRVFGYPRIMYGSVLMVDGSKKIYFCLEREELFDRSIISTCFVGDYSLRNQSFPSRSVLTFQHLGYVRFESGLRNLKLHEKEIPNITVMIEVTFGRSNL